MKNKSLNCYTSVRIQITPSHHVYLITVPPGPVSFAFWKQQWAFLTVRLATEWSFTLSDNFPTEALWKWANKPTLCLVNTNCTWGKVAAKMWNFFSHQLLIWRKTDCRRKQDVNLMKLQHDLIGCDHFYSLPCLNTLLITSRLNLSSDSVLNDC